MANNRLYVAGQNYTLAGSGITSTATTIQLASFKTPDPAATLLTMANFGSIGYAALEPATSKVELISFTGVTQNADGTATLTGVTRGIGFTSPYTAVAGNNIAHSGGAILIITNTPEFYSDFANKSDDETVAGAWIFSQSPIVPTPTTSGEAATKGYADGLAIAGSPNASTTVKGIGEVSVAPVSPTTPIFVGDNDGRVPTQSENDALVGDNTDIAVGSGNKMVTQTGLQHNAEKYAADTSGSSTAYIVALSPVPTSLTAGMIIYAKIVNANTTTTPTLNPNSLGAKTIVKGVSTPLVVGDIAANMFCTFIYDGTNFVLQNPSQAITYNTGQVARTTVSGSGTLAIPHGLTVVPKFMRFTTTGKTPLSNAVYINSYGTAIGTANQNVQFWTFGGTSMQANGMGNATGIILKGFDASAVTVVWSGTIGSIDATNINITLTYNGGGASTYDIDIQWEAFV